MDNADLQAWSVSDWEQRWSYKYDPTAPVPDWSTQVNDVLGAAAPKLRSIEDVGKALDVLYRWRISVELEESMMCI